MNKDPNSMLDNLGGLPIREQRDILLITTRNLCEHIERGGSITCDGTIAEFLDAASDGKLRNPNP